MKAAIIQARMGSTRLPGKVLADIAGKPMLWHVISRMKYAKRIDDIIVATTILSEDKQILELASEMGIKSYAGSREDVLDRYYQAAIIYKADVIVRITADCPLIDPNIIDRTIEFYLTHDFDYVSTAIKPTYPDGIDTEVFSFVILEKAWKEASFASEREHVTPYIRKNSQIFRIKSLENDEDLSYMRWTVDEERDLGFVREVYKRLYCKKGNIFYMKDVINLLRTHPQIMNINKGILRDEGYLKSLREEKVVEK